MEKDRVICLLYCGGADGAALYVNRKKITSLDSMVDLPTLLHDIFKEKKCVGTEVYSIDDDDITSEAFDAYYRDHDTGAMMRIVCDGVKERLEQLLQIVHP